MDFFYMDLHTHTMHSSRTLTLVLALSCLILHNASPSCVVHIIKETTPYLSTRKSQADRQIWTKMYWCLTGHCCTDSNIKVNKVS